MTSKKPSYGDKVRISSNIPPYMFEALKKFAEPGEARWEARLLRKILRDWLEAHGVVLPEERTDAHILAAEGKPKGHDISKD
jgi:hypothetical protein